MFPRPPPPHSPLEKHSNVYTSDPRTQRAYKALVDDYVYQEYMFLGRLAEIFWPINEVVYYLS